MNFDNIQSIKDVDFIYCFIRKDISPVQQIIQLAHAAYNAGRSFSEVPGEPHICLFEVANQKELKEAYHWLVKQGIPNEMFYEPDNKMGFSAIVTHPISDMSVRSLFKDFKLHDGKMESTLDGVS